VNLQPIYPPSQHYLPSACTSCGGDVRCDNGFADLDGKPYKAYVCAGCTITAIGGNRVSAMVGEAQMRDMRERNVL
jgi:hypothetical protein